MRRLALPILALVLIGVASYFLFRQDTPIFAPSPPDKATPGSNDKTSANPRPRTSGPPEGPNFYAFPERTDPPRYSHPPEPDDHRLTRLQNGTVQINPAMDHARSLHSNDTTPAQDIENINAIIGLYYWIYQQNPVGDNVDIVDQLTGNNEKKVIVLPPDHPDINANGELVDRFGNPYFFHALSEEKMDIWSYGPDGIVGTIDDVVLYGLEDDPPTEIPSPGNE
ncbi:MAG: hypothetical protein AAGD22_09115 [Verrucomicrobiota bacterium]